MVEVGTNYPGWSAHLLFRCHSFYGVHSTFGDDLSAEVEVSDMWTVTIKRAESRMPTAILILPVSPALTCILHRGLNEFTTR